MPARRVRPPKSKKNSPIIDGAKFIKRFQPKLIYDQRGLLYQDLPIGCVRTLKGGRLYQEILREKNSQYYGGAEIIKIFFRGRPRRESMAFDHFILSWDPPNMIFDPSESSHDLCVHLRPPAQLSPLDKA